MNRIIPKFHKAVVLVVGDLILDRYWFSSVNKISPEAPIPIYEINKTEERPGGVANVAMNIAALGSRVYLVGFTGNDELSHILEKKLKKLKVSCNFIILPEYKTISKLRVIKNNHLLARMDFEQNFGDIDPKDLLETVDRLLPKVKTLVISDYNKGTLSCVREIIMRANSMNVPVLVDPSGRKFNEYCGSTLIKPNLSEFENMVGLCKNENILIDRGVDYIIQNKISSMLITRAEKGMILIQKEKKPIYFSATAKKVLDVTGAGDTVIGIIGASLASGNTLIDSIHLANLAAGFVVEKMGTSFITYRELKKIIEKSCPIKKKFGIIEENELIKLVKDSKKKGEKIVMTSGIFDIIHVGHINYLSNARKLGDRLIVAINSDESTKRIKGKNRPINPLENRMIILESLKSVDWIVPFHEDTPKRLIKNILPDILVKGGDYQIHQIAGGKEVLKNGGKIKTLKFEKNFSTTKIINFIKTIFS